MASLERTNIKSERMEHLTARGAAGCFYCRSLNSVVEGEFLFCEACPLFGGFAETDGRPAVRCVYFDDEETVAKDVADPAEEAERIKQQIADGGSGEFPDYLPDEADDDAKLCCRAIQFAARAHKGDFRKGNRLPYIVHPMEVMSLVSQMTDDAEVIAAAALHDVVEDTPYTLADIREAFGERVAELVAMESEDKRPDLPKSETWRIRKEESLAHDKYIPLEAKYIMLADKLSNMRATLRDFEKDGHAIWQKFNMKDELQQAWYYRSVAEVLKELADEPLYQEYQSILQTIFA